MSEIRKSFIKRNLTAILVTCGIITYVIVAGISGSCPMCSAVTRFVGLSPSGDSTAQMTPRSLMPSWELMDLEGRTVRSSDFEGKVIVLDFWATWCPPCKREIPGFIELQARYKDSGLIVVGVSLDEGGRDVVAAYASKMGINYPVVMGDARMVEVFGGITSIPTTFIVDRDGRIVERHVGYVSKARFEKSIAPLLADALTI